MLLVVEVEVEEEGKKEAMSELPGRWKFELDVKG